MDDELYEALKYLVWRLDDEVGNPEPVTLKEAAKALDSNVERLVYLLGPYELTQTAGPNTGSLIIAKVSNRTKHTVAQDDRTKAWPPSTWQVPDAWT